MKQASPAQLAARAAFAARARAGAFKRKAKPATKRASPARKRNPVGPKDGEGAEYFVKVRGRGWVREFARNATPDRWRYSKTFAGAQVFTEGQAVSIKTMCDHVMAPCELMGVREANPKKRAVKFQHDVRASDRMDNVVQAKHGREWGDIARFVDFVTAKQYAQAYADAHGVQVKILGNFGDKYAKARA